tara:strand:+ start:71 stop:484 length:414 start_codon:yes stop_codon:yes gene_type:complete
MNNKNCNLCSFLLVVFAIFVVMGLVYYNNFCNKKNAKKLENFISNDELLMAPTPTQNMMNNPTQEQPGIEYVRPITNEEFEQIFRDFYQNASKLAITTKKMKEIMNEYQTVYEENAKTQEEFDRLKDELQNGIKALG